MAKIWIVSHQSFEGCEILKACKSKESARAYLENIWQEFIDAHSDEDEDQYTFEGSLLEREDGHLEFDFGDESDFYAAEEVEMED